MMKLLPYFPKFISGPGHSPMVTRIFLSSLFLFGSLLVSAQNIVPSSGADTSTACVGILRDPGGAANYPNYADGTFVIDPPGNSTVSLVFSQFNCYYGDYVYLYDGVGTSGTYLGSYSGTSLPNNGNSITSTSGAITVRFTSNSSSNNIGFTTTWTTNSSSAPTASFAVGSTSPAFNTPVLFINTTTGGADYIWEFGDGSTSTAANPTHAYTTTGAVQVRLIATNCSGSDTSAYTTLNVQSAPAGNVSDDTVSVTVPCGSSNSTSLTISNSGSGNLNYSLSLEQPTSNLIFDEDFENSSLGAFSNNSATQTISYGTTNAPEGSRYLELGGYGSVYNGLLGSFTPSQPTSYSYYTKTDSYTSYHGYNFLGGLDQYGSFREIFYSYFRYNDLRLVYRQNGYYNTYYHTISTGSWAKIELKNIDFTNETYDIYVDGVAVVTAAEFLISVTELSEIRIYNNYTATVGLDKVELSSLDLLDNVTFNPSSGNLSNGSNNVIFINADASDLLAGVYWLNFVLQSNDTALDGMVIPLRLEVTGQSELHQSASCLSYGNVYTGIPVTDSILVWNTGCDSLQLDSVYSTDSDISFIGAPYVLGMDDSTYVKVQLNSTAIGSYNDTISIFDADTSLSICITGQSVLTPVIGTDSTDYTLSFTGCSDSASFQFIINNSGQGILNWSTNSSVSQNVTDDFEASSFNTSLWANWSGGVALNTNCGVISGSQSMVFGSSSGPRWIETVPLNTSNGGTISFTMNQSSCDFAESGEGIYIKYSTDNGLSWQQVNYNYTSLNNTNYPVSVAIPAAAQGTGIKFRLEQTSNSGSTYDFWMVDDFAITSQISNALVFHPDTGSIAASSADTLTAKIAIAGMVSGTYNFTANIFSNDPLNPVYSFPVTLYLNGIPNVQLPAACTDFDTTMAGTTVQDSILLYNDGCADLVISSLNVNQFDFSVMSVPPTIAPGDSAYIQLSFNPGAILGLRQDTLSVISNDTTGYICLSGYAIGAPAATLDVTPITDTIFSCNDSILIQRNLGNLLGLNDLAFKVGGQDGSGLQDVLDTFKAAHSSLVSLIPSPYYFSEGTLGYQINDGGGDMYDGGNMLSTNIGGPIYYSDDLLTTSSHLGSNGEYFSYKGSGMWLFAADLDGVSSFTIDGNLGADGSGISNATILTTTRGGVSYKGFVKRVYNAYDPSVNHLVIVEDQPGLSHSYSTNTDYDNHVISGLANTTRIYYLLYAGSGGSFIDDTTTANIMNGFLDLVEGDALPDWMRVSPDSGQVAQADTTMLNIWLKSAGLATGTHNSQVVVNTNDPQNPTLTIPVQLTVQGSASVNRLSNACISYSNVLQGAVASDTAWVHNDGCDTLHITAASGSLSVFGIANLPVAILPGDTVPLVTTFSPQTVGSFTDTLLVANNDSVFEICVSGTSQGAPVLDLPVDSLVVEVNSCNLIKYQSFKLNNTGQGNMNYSLDIGGYQGVSQQAYNTNSATTTHSFSGVSQSDTLRLRIILHGDYDTYYERTYLTIDNSYYYGTVPDNNKNYVNDTIDLLFYGTNVQNWTSDGVISFELDNTYDVDGGTGSFHRVEVELTSAVNWVSVVGSNSGSVNAGASANRNLLFNSVGLSQGSYHTNLNISTNAPGAAVTTVPLTMNVVSKPEIALSDTCLFYSQTLVGDTATYPLKVYNDGCQPLNVSSIIASNPAFVVSPSSGTIAVGDSLTVQVSFVPTTSNTFSALLLINNNDTNRVVCLNASSAALPVADFQYVVADSCTGQVVFTNESLNNSGSSYWEFGDGGTSNQIDPIYQFNKPGSYRVTLRVTNSAGFDTISKVIQVNPLYAYFSMSADTVRINTTVNFYDSSQVANSWTWNFGDGSTSSLQNPDHAFAVKGKYEITLNVTDARGCARSIKRDLFVFNDISIAEYSVDGEHYELYPNPADEWVLLASESIDWQDYGIKLFDATGKLIMAPQSAQNAGELRLDLNGLPAGMYHLLIDKAGVLKSSRSLIVK